jgi:6-phosphogluconolactonase
MAFAPRAATRPTLAEAMPTPGASVRSSRIDWHAHAGEAAWVDAASGAIHAALQTALDTHAETWLLLSGGTTPAPVYRALAGAPLDWSRVVVSLVDERDVEPDAPGSNARLIRETLLCDQAAAARFVRLREPGQSLGDAVVADNAMLRANIAIAVLGMGDDAHVASLFPGAANLDAALTSTQPYAAIDARGCPAAGDWPSRISLTPTGMAQAQRRLLLVRGEHKRAVLQRALQPGDRRDAPIRVAIDSAGAALRVDWCA